tara:strand:- start:1132 stop:2040 length:909 start_codon:yes stop_codon:yes gene_type:complete
MKKKYKTLSKRLVLGTANLGTCKYGINKYKISNNNKKKILKYAIKNEITYFDTANTYGSEKNLDFQNIKVFTKIKPIKKNLKFKKKKELVSFIEDSIKSSLKKLKINSIYCLLIHKVEDLKINNYDIIKILNSFKKKGLIKNIGVSIDFYQNIEKIIRNKSIRFIQLPVNIYDKRWKIFFTKENKKYTKNKKFIARSIFMQGVLNKNIWPNKIKDQKKIINKLNNILIKKLSIKKIDELMFRYVNSLKEIDYILFGVTKLSTIKKNLKYFDKKKIIQKKINLIDSFTNKIENKFYDIINWSS